MSDLEQQLKDMSVEGKLYRKVPNKPDRIQCYVAEAAAVAGLPKYN